MQKRTVGTVFFIAISIAVSFLLIYANPIWAGEQVSTDVATTKGVAATAGENKTLRTSLGTLTNNITLLAGAKLEPRGNPQKLVIVFAFIHVDSKNAMPMPMNDRIQVYTGNKPDHPARITLAQDLNSGQWLATDGYICMDGTLTVKPNYMLLDGDTVKVVGGKDRPVYIEGQPFADTTVYIRNGKPHGRSSGGCSKFKRMCLSASEWNKLSKATRDEIECDAFVELSDKCTYKEKFLH